MGKEKKYECTNGAYHANLCCDTCWNGHPEAVEQQMFLGTNRQKDIVENIFVVRAMHAGFTETQAKFLYKLN